MLAPVLHLMVDLLIKSKAPPKARRQRHLIAMPFFGTGGGGLGHISGEIISGLLQRASCVAKVGCQTHKAP